MNDLVVAHVVENVSEDEFRLFLRLFHRSGLPAKADLVFIFASASKFASLIEEEKESFLKLIDHYRELNTTAGGGSPANFDPTQILKSNQSGEGERGATTATQMVENLKPSQLG